MKEGLKNLAAMEYPGRVIIIGKDRAGENIIVVYAITGRSPSSQARILVAEGNAVWTKPLDESLVEKGNRDLLVYPAIFIGRGIVVSNGKQTEDIHLCLSRGTPASASEVLKISLQHWDYEPDAPNYTPRISGCILPSGNSSLGIIIRAPDGSSMRKFYDISPGEGRGECIATYQGEDRDPLPSFTGRPLPVELEGKTSREVAEEVYQALFPARRVKDYRVAVACVFSRSTKVEKFGIHIINRQNKA